MADYRDPLITADADGVTIRRYYFPIPLPKRIRWSRIRAVRREDMGGLSGQYRIWGSGNLRTYYNLDPQRPSKQVKFVLDTGRWIRPAVTPDDPDAFAGVLTEHRLPT